jgi:hypothetical protein
MRRGKKTNLGMFPMDKRCHHGSYRKMQRVFEEHFGHVQFASLHILCSKLTCEKKSIIINIKHKKKMVEGFYNN